MNHEGFEFHDSVLAAIERVKDELHLLFEPAYVHRSAGEPGRDAGTGWSVKIRLTLFGSLVTQMPLDLPCAVWEGVMRIAESSFGNVVPLPLDHVGETQVCIALVSGRILEATGSRVQLVAVGAYEFVENVPAFAEHLAKE